MGKRQKCSYCEELAVAYRVEADGAKTSICAYHIPVDDGERIPQLREAGDAKRVGE
jgi:hypothetical protein